MLTQYLRFILYLPLVLVYADDSNQPILRAQKIFPDKVISDAAIGKLKDSEILAVLAKYKVSDLAEMAADDSGYSLTKEKIKLIVLDGKTGRELAATPGWWLHDRHFWQLGIDKESVFIYLDGSGGCCEKYYYGFQFKIVGEDFILIGVEERLNGFGAKRKLGEPNGYIVFDYGSSINFLTRKNKVWRSQRKSSADAPNEAIGKNYRTEKYISFSLSEPIKMGNFSYWDYLDKTKKIKGLSSYFNDDLLLVDE